MRKILAIISDLHGGCNLGLMNPATQLIHFAPDGEQTTWIPSMTASQKYLWGLYESAIGQVVDWAGKDEIVLFDLGDQTHGNRWAQELVSTRLDDQIIIAANNLAPWTRIPNVKVMRLVSGTGVHGLFEGAAPRMITELVRAKYPKIDTRLIEHGEATVNGALVDYAHHGPGPGMRHWLAGNVARFYLRDRVQAAILAGRRPPDLISRGHVHTPIYEYLEEGQHQAHLLVLPSLCMLGEHARQATKSTPVVTHGIAAVEIIDGKITAIQRYYKSMDITTKEEL